MNSKKKTYIFGYFKKRSVKQFLLFVLITFIFLIFSKLSNDYKQTIKLNVNLLNIQDEIVLKNDSINTISAYIEAKGFSLIPFIFKSSTDIFLDGKKDVTARHNHFVFDVQKHQYLIEGQLGKSYKVLSLFPDTLLLSYSKSASKLVPLTLNSSINYAVGFDIKGNFTLSVDSVKIVGPASEIDKIISISTDNLELTDVKKNINLKIGVNTDTLENIEVYPKFVDISGEVSRFSEGTIEIPITIVNKPNKLEINYFPKTVTVAYYVDLEKYNSVKAIDFIVECDFSDTDDNQTYFVPKVVKKPEFVKRVNIKQKRIDFIKL